eukprot:CAMPEP_0168294238 /NCGR_PEP_ID=MMETSP0142_2-20121227/8525_1 /TAXON_ID=44445 /ORGANISM="Pseudo-nitzschia australis, Strain 10249 10 AB" /LENGTH=43 /DNA_ID= /DNA_START= /DNA_END= /DNA_ORIENTATION=
MEHDLVAANLSLTEFWILLQKATSMAFLSKALELRDSRLNWLP